MSFETETEVVQEIANAVTLAIPDESDWTRITLIVDIDRSGMMNFNNTYVDQEGRTLGVPFADAFPRLFRELAKTVARSGDPVTGVTLTIDESGKFQSKYSYDEPSFPERAR